jgi:hypothetical protein
MTRSLGRGFGRFFDRGVKARLDALATACAFSDFTVWSRIFRL